MQRSGQSFAQIFANSNNQEQEMSKKPNQSRKSTSSGPANKVGATAQPRLSAEQPAQTDEPNNLASIHDLRGLALVSLPRGLRALIGDESFAAMVARLESSQLHYILRREDKVVFVAMPIYTFDEDRLGPLPESEILQSHSEQAKAATPATQPPSPAPTKQAALRRERKPRSPS